MNVLITQSLQPRPEIELAYLAGIIDGEGTVGIYRNSAFRNHFYPTVIVVQRDPKIPQWIQERFGGCMTHKVHRIRGFKRERYQYWRWYITGKTTGAFLKQVRPYLLTKGEQADCCIALSETILHGAKVWLYPDGTQRLKKTGKPGRPNAKPPDLIAYQESLYHRCKQLNSPPVVEG